MRRHAQTAASVVLALALGAYACADDGHDHDTVDDADSASEVDAVDASDTRDDTTGRDTTVGPPPIGTPRFSLDDYPRVDGSTSTEPLARLMACEILGVPYAWTSGYGDGVELEIVPVVTSPSQVPTVAAIMELVVHNKTQAAFTNLVDGLKDLILVANPASESIRQRAADAGVVLVEEPIALDALVIIVNEANSLSALTLDQVRAIYKGELTDWGDVGGPVGRPIKPYVRPLESGSQQLFDAYVMHGEPMPEWPPDRIEMGMGGLIDAVRNDADAIGYSVYYYVTFQYPSDGYRILAVDGVRPSREALRARTYGLTAPVLMVTLASLPATSTAAEMHDWLLGTSGQAAIDRSGYVPHPDIVAPALQCLPAWARADFGPALPPFVPVMSCCTAETCAKLGLVCDPESCRCAEVPCDTAGSACADVVLPGVAEPLVCGPRMLGQDGLGVVFATDDLVCQVAGDQCPGMTYWYCPTASPTDDCTCVPGCRLLGDDCPGDTVCSTDFFPLATCHDAPRIAEGERCGVGDGRRCDGGLACAWEAGDYRCVRPTCGALAGSPSCGAGAICEPLVELPAYGRCRTRCDLWSEAPSSDCEGDELCVAVVDPCGDQQGLCKPRATLGIIHGPGETCGYDVGVCDAGLACSRNTCLPICRIGAPSGAPDGCTSGSRCFGIVTADLVASATGVCAAECEVGGDDCAGGWCAPEQFDAAVGHWVGRCWTW